MVVTVIAAVVLFSGSTKLDLTPGGGRPAGKSSNEDMGECILISKFWAHKFWNSGRSIWPTEGEGRVNKSVRTAC